MVVHTIYCEQLAAEDPPPAKITPPTKVNWKDWIDHARFVGEVTKIEKDGSFIVTEKATQQQPGRGRTRPQVKTTTIKHQVTFAEQGMLRYKDLPKKLNEKGKRVPYSPAELRESRMPLGTPGYAADRSALEIGQIVEVTLVRPKSVKPTELTVQDLRIKWAVILSEPTPIQEGTEEKGPPAKAEKKDDKKKD